jgi:amino acid transporter
MSEQQDRGFGTFSGVFRPVTLTVLGAMLYLREGWLVGELGLLGALLVMAIGAAITGTTAMSLASIASNVRVRPGGAFAIISQSLGLEAGGAIGIPLYIAQSASAAMYTYAFAEAWGFLFPDHPAPLVSTLAFFSVALIAWRSSGLAAKAQGVMIVVVVVALLSALGGLFTAPVLHSPMLLSTTSSTSPLTAFAIFFPAFTGIMVGAGMSGSLENPRRSIPRGTMMAWGATLAPPAELSGSRMVMIDHAAVPQLVLAGLLASTLMATLSSLVAAPRLLAAMAAHGVVPGSRWLAQETADGEPRNAVLVTTGFAALGLAAGSLDAIAPVITSFFIMTYLAINGVVYLERLLAMISFRPAFQVPRWVSLAGAGLCLLGLSLGSPFGGVIELMFVLGLYTVLSRRKLDTPWETVRSGIAATLAAWAARRASHIERSERAWKPDLLTPVASAEQISALRPLVESFIGSDGSIRWVGLGSNEALPEALSEVTATEREAGLHATWTRLRTENFMEGVGLTLDALQSALFPPNLVVVDETRVSDEEITHYLAHCRALSAGMALWLPHPDGGLGRQEVINVWISDRAPEWQLQLHLANLDLPVLIGLLLARSWGARLRLWCVVRDPTQVDAGVVFLRDLVDQARLPPKTTVHVMSGSFMDALKASSTGDLNLFGMPPQITKERLAEIRTASGASCLWLLDSGRESVLA